MTKHDGPLNVSEELHTNGQQNGPVLVQAGGVLHHHGQLNGDLTVFKGGVAMVHGQLNGNVRSDGTLMIYGQFGGVVYPGEGLVAFPAGAMWNRVGGGCYVLSESGVWQLQPKGEAAVSSTSEHGPWFRWVDETGAMEPL